MPTRKKMKVNPKLLLVEDNRLLRWWMTSSLTQEGFEVTALESLDEFRSTPPEDHFDVLVTDWRLADGYKGTDVLRLARERYPQIIAVLMSAEAGEQLAAEARREGFDLVLQKPVPSADMVAAVYSVTARHAAGVAS